MVHHWTVHHQQLLDAPLSLSQVQTGAELETDKYLITVEEQTNGGTFSSPPAANNCASLTNAQSGTGAAPPPLRPSRHGLSRQVGVRQHHRPAPYLVSPVSSVGQALPTEHHRPVSGVRPSLMATQIEQCQTLLNPLSSSLSPLSTESDVAGFSVYGQSSQKPSHLVPFGSNLELKQLMEHHSRG